MIVPDCFTQFPSLDELHRIFLEISVFQDAPTLVHPNTLSIDQMSLRLFLNISDIWYSLHVPFLLLRSGKSVTGGKDLALSAEYTPSFCRAIFAAWFRAWVCNPSRPRD